MRALSSSVVGCAADIAITAFNAGDLNLLFMRAGLGEFAPGSAYGKSALVSAGITPALRAAGAGDAAVSDGLDEFVRLVAEKVAPRTPGDEIAPGSVFWRLREAIRADGFDLRTDFSADSPQRRIGLRLLPLDEPAMPLSEEITALEADFTCSA